MKEINIFKDDERQKISLMYDDKTNRRFIKRRIYDDKRDIYKTLKKISHPNIPKIIDIEFDSDTVVTEEYIEGTTLSKFMQDKKVLSKKQIKKIAKQLMSAINELHKSNIIHRDIKPDNIIIDKYNHIWLIDYDISRIYRKEMRKDTESVGTFGYAPIEQFGMLPTDYKTDIYAFGVTLSELLEYAKVKGSMYRISQKCKMLDPSQRYKSISALKCAFIMSSVLPTLIFAIIVILGIMVYFAFRVPDNVAEIDSADTISEEYIEVDGEMIKLDDEIMSLLCFSGFELSDTYNSYTGYGNFNSTFIFNCEDYLMHLSFMEDSKNSGTILMGKGSKTQINSQIELKDGIFSLSLSDAYGNTFSKDFKYNPAHSYKPLYNKNRRVNAELVCWDMDGDNINELLIGICDASFTVENEQIFMYFNYSQGWCLKYDEARGFTLCDGEMFSPCSKFALIKNDLRVHLPVWAETDDNKSGYELKGDTLVAFY